MRIPEHYQLSKDDKDAFEVYDLRDKTTFQISKRGLHPHHSAQIKALKMYDGGEVKPDKTPIDKLLEQSTEDNTAVQAPAIPQGTPVYGPFLGGGAADMTTPAPMDSAFVPAEGQPMMPLSTPSPAVEAALNPSLNAPMEAPSSPMLGAQEPTEGTLQNDAMTGAPSLDTLAGIQKQGIEGIRQEAKARSLQSQMFGQIYEKHMASEEARANDFSKRQSFLQTQADQIAKEISEGTVDPKRYIQNQSTLGKISTMIGIMLGGLGAGMQGSTRNMAWETFQKRIDEDIDAQKTELGKKQGLLADNFRQQGNLVQAENATRMQMNSALQGMLAKAAAQTADPILQAEAMQKIAQYRQSTIPLAASLAGYQSEKQNKQALIGMMKSGGEYDAVDLVNAGIIPKELQGEAYKEQAIANKHKVLTSSIDDLYKRLANEQKATPGKLLSKESYERVQALKAQLKSTVMSAVDVKRLSPQLMEELIKPLEPGTFQGKKTIEEQKQSLINIIKQNAEPTPLLEKYGVVKPMKIEQSQEIMKGKRRGK